jgi:hypothetical protein
VIRADRQPSRLRTPAQPCLVPGVLAPAVGYPARMRRRSSTRWVVVAFVVLGVLVALVLIVRDLGDDDDVPEENGTVPARSATG